MRRPLVTPLRAPALVRARSCARARLGRTGLALLLTLLAVLVGGAGRAAATSGVSGNAALELGQPANGGAEWTDMTRGARTDRGFDTPVGVAQDASGHILVVDGTASRVQGWTSMPVTDGAPMDHVLGQPTKTSYGVGCTASAMRTPTRASIVATGGNVRAAVADTANHRVLLWSTTTAAWPPANGAAAPVVIGQPNATTCSAGNSQTKLDSPGGVWTDGTRVIVSDTQNNRLMGWNSWPTTGAAADWVIGQTSWTGATFGASATQLDEPKGIWSDGSDRILVADSINNRVLYYDLPGAGTWIPSGTIGGISATWAVGQSSMTGTGTGCLGTTLDLPQGVSSDGTKFAVADTNGDRVLVWNAMPTAHGQGASFVLGQTAMNQCNRNQGVPTTLTAAAVDGPTDVWTDGSTVLAVDSLNHRVLRWSWPAANGTTATRVLGHPNVTGAGPFDAIKDAIFRFRTASSATHLDQVVPYVVAGTNRLLITNASYNWVHYYASQPAANGQAPTWRFGQVDDAHAYYGGMASTNATSIGAPDGVWSDGTRLLMTDAAGDRVKVWDTFPTSENQAPDRILGQPTFTANGSGTTASAVDNPNGVVSDGTRIAVADDTNNRILLWDSWPTTMNQPADHVIGQPTFTAATPNNGGLSAHSLDNPHGLAWSGGKLAVADYGNDRILIWNSWPTVDNEDADVVVGQANFTSNGVAAFDHVHAVSMADNTLVWSADCGAAYFDPIPTANTTSTGTPLGAAACGTVAPARNQVREVGGVAIRAGKVWVSDVGHARVLRFDDTTSPAITVGATRSTDCTGTTFAWTTDESGSSEVWYDTVSHGAGLPSTYASSVVDPTITGLTHAVLVTGLVPGTTYYFKVQTKDGAGNATYSAEASFVAGGPPAPGTFWTADANAQLGALQAANVVAGSPHFSFVNNAGCSVDRQRTRVWSDPMDANVTGLWHLDGSGADASPTGAPIVLGAGSTSPTSGTSFAPPMGQEMSVDGIDDQASIAANAAFDRGNAFTYETWTKTTATSVSGLTNAFPTLVLKGSSCSPGAPSCNFEIYIDRATACLCVGVSRGGSMFTASGNAVPLVDGHWHHVAVTVDAANLVTLYLDGAVAATRALAGPVDAASQPIRVGSGNGGNRWSGQIDEVRYSSVARTAAEIRGSFEARQPHARLLWDSDPTDTGAPIASCAAVRCADVTYGSSGSAAAALTGGRSTVEAKVRPGAGAWSLTGSDWFEMDTGRAINQYVDDTNATTGYANRTAVTAVAPHLSWINTAGTSVDRDHTQVVNTPSDDVQLLLHLDGSAADASGNGFTGSGSGAPAPTYAPAQTNFGGASGALRLTNGNDLVTVPSDPKLTQGNDFTIETWFRTSSIANDPYPIMVMKTSGSGGCGSTATCQFSLEFDRAANLAVFAAVSGGTEFDASTSATPVVDGAWHHMAGTVDATNVMRLYVDGVLASTVPMTGPAATCACSVKVGGDTSGGEQFAGDLDEVRYSDVARSAGEITGYVATRRPHGTVMWDSDATEAGTSSFASCADLARCPDRIYGTGGGSLDLVRDNGRYYARTRLRTTGGTWTDWSNWDWFETRTTMTLSLTSSATVALGSLLPGTDATGTSTMTVQTNNASGYTLTATGPSDTAALGAPGPVGIAPWSGTPATPTAWPAATPGGFGLTVLSATGGKDTARWGTGTLATDFATLAYAGPRLTTSTLLHARPAYSAGTDTVTTAYRADIGAVQAPGTYSGVVTYTALANP